MLQQGHFCLYLVLKLSLGLKFWKGVDAIDETLTKQIIHTVCTIKSELSSVSSLILTEFPAVLLLEAAALVVSLFKRSLVIM